MVFKVGFGFIGKILTYKKGSLMVFSLTISSGMLYYLDKLITGTDTRQLIFPILAQFFGIIFFSIFSAIDLITGLQAAKYANSKLEVPRKNYVKSYKLWRTLWKGLGIIILTSMIMFLVIFMEIIKNSYPYWICLWILLGTWLMACGFEFHSIGENLEKRAGTKPSIFGFWEKILTAIQKKAIEKIDTSFNILEGDEESKKE